MVISLLVAAALICWPAQPLQGRRFGQHNDPGRPRFGGELPGPAALQWMTAAAVVAAIAAAAAVAGAAAGAALAIVVCTARVLAQQQLSLRRRRRGLADILAAVRMLARELQAGAEPVAATRNAGALARGDGAIVMHNLAQMMQAQDRDRSGVTALQRTFSRTAGRTAPGGDGGPDGRGRTGTARQSSPAADALRRLAAGWILSSRFGVALAPLIESAAAEMAEALAADARRVGEVAGPRMSGYVMSGLPVMGLVLGAGMGVDPVGVLLGTTVGHVLLVTGVLLTSVGLLWSARIVG